MARPPEAPRPFDPNGILGRGFGIDSRPDPVVPPQQVNDELLLAPFSVSIIGMRDAGRELRIDAVVLNRDNGRPNRVVFTALMPPADLVHGAPRTELIRSHLCDFLTHEVDECLRHPDGRHVRDPHAEEFPFTADVFIPESLR